METRRNHLIKWGTSGGAAFLSGNEKVLPLLAEVWAEMQESVSPGSPTHTSVALPRQRSGLQLALRG